MFSDLLLSDLKTDRRHELLDTAERRHRLLRPSIVARAFSLCRGATVHPLPTPSDQPSPDVARVA